MDDEYIEIERYIQQAQEEIGQVLSSLHNVSDISNSQGGSTGSVQRLGYPASCRDISATAGAGQITKSSTGMDFEAIFAENNLLAPPGESSWYNTFPSSRKKADRPTNFAPPLGRKLQPVPGSIRRKNWKFYVSGNFTPRNKLVKVIPFEQDVFCPSSMPNLTKGRHSLPDTGCEHRSTDSIMAVQQSSASTSSLALDPGHSVTNGGSNGCHGNGMVVEGTSLQRECEIGKSAFHKVAQRPRLPGVSDAVIHIDSRIKVIDKSKLVVPQSPPQQTSKSPSKSLLCSIPQSESSPLTSPKSVHKSPGPCSFRSVPILSQSLSVSSTEGKEMAVSSADSGYCSSCTTTSSNPQLSPGNVHLQPRPPTEKGEDKQEDGDQRKMCFVAVQTDHVMETLAALTSPTIQRREFGYPRFMDDTVLCSPGTRDSVVNRVRPSALITRCIQNPDGGSPTSPIAAFSIPPPPALEKHETRLKMQRVRSQSADRTRAERPNSHGNAAWERLTRSPSREKSFSPEPRSLSPPGGCTGRPGSRSKVSRATQTHRSIVSFSHQGAVSPANDLRLRRTGSQPDVPTQEEEPSATGGAVLELRKTSPVWEKAGKQPKTRESGSEKERSGPIVGGAANGRTSDCTTQTNVPPLDTCKRTVKSDTGEASSKKPKARSVIHPEKYLLNNVESSSQTKFVDNTSISNKPFDKDYARRSSGKKPETRPCPRSENETQPKKDGNDVQRAGQDKDALPPSSSSHPVSPPLQLRQQATTSSSESSSPSSVLEVDREIPHTHIPFCSACDDKCRDIQGSPVVFVPSRESRRVQARPIMPMIAEDGPVWVLQHRATDESSTAASATSSASSSATNSTSSSTTSSASSSLKHQHQHRMRHSSSPPRVIVSSELQSRLVETGVNKKQRRKKSSSKNPDKHASSPTKEGGASLLDSMHRKYYPDQYGNPQQVKSKSAEALKTADEDKSDVPYSTKSAEKPKSKSGNMMSDTDRFLDLEKAATVPPSLAQSIVSELKACMSTPEGLVGLAGHGSLTHVHSPGGGLVDEQPVHTSVSDHQLAALHREKGKNPDLDPVRELAEIEALEACKWLRAAGFPQYAQMYEEHQFPIEIASVEKDHDFLDEDSIHSLFRRLNTLNKCASMKIEAPPRKSGDDSDEEDQCALSDRWQYQRSSRRWSRMELDEFLPQGVAGDDSAERTALRSSSSHDSLLTDNEESLSQQEDSPSLRQKSGHSSQRVTPSPTPSPVNQMPKTSTSTTSGFESENSGNSQFSALPMSPSLRRAASNKLKGAKDAFLKRMESLKTRKGSVRRPKLVAGQRVEIGNPVLMQTDETQERMDKLGCRDISPTTESHPLLTDSEPQSPASLNSTSSLTTTTTSHFSAWDRPDVGSSNGSVANGTVPFDSPTPTNNSPHLLGGNLSTQSTPSHMIRNHRRNHSNSEIMDLFNLDIDLFPDESFPSDSPTLMTNNGCIETDTGQFNYRTGSFNLGTSGNRHQDGVVIRRRPQQGATSACDVSGRKSPEPCAADVCSAKGEHRLSVYDNVQPNQSLSDAQEELDRILQTLLQDINGLNQSLGQTDDDALGGLLEDYMGTTHGKKAQEDAPTTTTDSGIRDLFPSQSLEASAHSAAGVSPNVPRATMELVCPDVAYRDTRPDRLSSRDDGLGASTSSNVPQGGGGGGEEVTGRSHHQLFAAGDGDARCNSHGSGVSDELEAHRVKIEEDCDIVDDVFSPDPPHGQHRSGPSSALDSGLRVHPHGSDSTDGESGRTELSSVTSYPHMRRTDTSLGSSTSSATKDSSELSQATTTPKEDISSALDHHHQQVCDDCDSTGTDRSPSTSNIPVPPSQHAATPRGKCPPHLLPHPALPGSSPDQGSSGSGGSISNADISDTDTPGSREEDGSDQMETPDTRERRDSGVGSSLTRAPSDRRRHRIRWHSFVKSHRPSLNSHTLQISSMSAGHLNMLRKLSLVKVTSLMEKHTPSSRSGWNWIMPKIRIKRFKAPDYSGRTVFGVPLLVILQRTGQPLPQCILSAMRCLRRTAMDAVGIFRKSGVRSRIQKLRNDLEENPEIGDFESLQAYDVADLLKQYFRELPECLLTDKLSETFINIYTYVPLEQRSEALQWAVLLLPDENREVLQSLLLFLSDMARHAQENQMTASNLAVCFAPSLFNIHGLRSNISASPKRTRKSAGIPDQRELMEQKAAHECLAQMIIDCKKIFLVPEEMLGKCRLSYLEAGDPVPLEELGKRRFEDDSTGYPAYMESCIQGLLKEAREKFKGWVAVPTPHEAELSYKKVGDGHPLRLWKVSVEVEAPPTEVLNRILRERHLWDEDMLEWRVVEKLDAQLEVFQYLHSSMAPHPARDFCELRSWRCNLPKGACVLVSTSVEHHSVTVQQGAVRSVVLASRYLIEPCGSGKSRLTHISRVDIRSHTPEWYNKAYGHICANYVSRVCDSFTQNNVGTDGPETKV